MELSKGGSFRYENIAIKILNYKSRFSGKDMKIVYGVILLTDWYYV